MNSYPSSSVIISSAPASKASSINCSSLTFSAAINICPFLSNMKPTHPEDFNAVRDALVEKGYEFVSADIKLIPQTTTVLDNEGQVKSMEKLIDLLEEDDDVQNVYHNWEITE